jgi:hypothetical protein
MRLLIAIVVAAAIPVSISSEQPRRPDPSDLGPFAIGHTRLLLIDSRPDPSAPPTRGTRTIGVNIWYPVDGAVVAGRTADGLFLYNPFSTPPSWYRRRTGSGRARAYRRPRAASPRQRHYLLITKAFRLLS